MKCVSCNEYVDPKWVHAININICPWCGLHIMEEHLKNLFSTLRETMDSLAVYPEQVNDWLLSNHNYIKTDSPNIINYIPSDALKSLKKSEDDKDFLNRKESAKFTVKVKTENGEEEVIAEKIQSEETTNEFFKRAEVIKSNSPNQTKQQLGPNAYQSTAEKTEYLKKMAQQIKRTGSQGLTDPSGGSMALSAEMLDQADPEAVAEFQQMIAGGEVASSLEQDSMDDDLPGGDFILQANMAAAQGKSAGSGSQANAKDMAHLQRLQAKVSQARQNVASGNKGSFSRS
jgi:hypothetical protein